MIVPGSQLAGMRRQLTTAEAQLRNRKQRLRAKTVADASTAHKALNKFDTEALRAVLQYLQYINRHMGSYIINDKSAKQVLAAFVIVAPAQALRYRKPSLAVVYGETWIIARDFYTEKPDLIAL